jgi:16S rRNA (guanine966-N2)-methyltransferase
MRVIAGEAKGRRIGSLRNLGARPTTERVRSAVFSLLENTGIEDKRVVDLYAGTGSLGIEALSRGAKWVDFVEASSKRCSLLRSTIKSLGFSDKAKIHCMKVEKAVDILVKSYDLVLMDPPYTSEPPHWVIHRLYSLAVPGAILALGHSKRHVLESKYQGITFMEDRRYGDIIFSLYRGGEV